MIEHKLDLYSVTSNPVAPLPEHIPESEVTNLSQKDQSKSLAGMCDDHIPSSEVIPDSPVLLSPPEICSESHRYNYHHQQTISISPIVTELCIDNLPADRIVTPVHEQDIHSSDYKTLCKGKQPCLISAQSLNTNSGMLVCQNSPGG